MLIVLLSLVISFLSILVSVWTFAFHVKIQRRYGNDGPWYHLLLHPVAAPIRKGS